jgi:hypothetical protein
MCEAAMPPQQGKTPCHILPIAGLKLAWRKYSGVRMNFRFVAASWQSVAVSRREWWRSAEAPLREVLLEVANMEEQALISDVA